MNPATLTVALIGDLANVSIASTPGGIEQQEAADQRTLADPLREAVRQLTSLPRKWTVRVDAVVSSFFLGDGYETRCWIKRRQG